ncbi:MAG TPA: polysaccharide pyruvyl transferase family protein [Gallicola sp.]|nr:polysaccharide pyruvyl transferase family protein [Gallicola sp.]
MVVNNIYDLEIDNIVLFSYDSPFLNTIKEDYLSDFNINIIDVKFKDNFNIVEESKVRILTPIDILHNLSNHDEISFVIKNLDVLVVNGGGYFNSLWSMPHRIERLAKIIAPILVANNLNKKIIFTGNSYGPFTQDAEFFGCTFSVLKNSVVGTRDNLLSPMWASKIGIDKDRIEVIPDDLFIVNEKLINKDVRKPIKFERYIVMETYLPLDFIKGNITLFKEFSQSIYQKYGLNILFLPFNLKHGGMDQAIYFESTLNNYTYYDINSIGYLPIEDAVKLIKNAELVISSRYHALVVALSVATPIVSVLRDVLGDKRYYYNKNLGMLIQALDGIDFDERDYLRLDYLETLKFVTERFEHIVNVQKNNFNHLYEKNKENLKLRRKSFLERNIKQFINIDGAI